MLATEYAKYYGIQEQGKDEQDWEFRNRVADTLRAMGHVIEAHEAYANERYENSENVMAGLFGRVAQASGGIKYGGNEIENDIIAGKLLMSPEYEQQQRAREALVALFIAGLR